LDNFGAGHQQALVGQVFAEVVALKYPDLQKEIAREMLDGLSRAAALALLRNEALFETEMERCRAWVLDSFDSRRAAESGWESGWWGDQWSGWNDWSSWDGGQGSSQSRWQDHQGAYPRDPNPRGSVSDEFRWG